MIEAIGKHIVVKRAEEKTMSAGGIALVDWADGQKWAEGTVVSVGDAVETKRLDVGSRVVFGRYSGIEFETDEGKFVAMSDADVVCKT